MSMSTEKVGGYTDCNIVVYEPSMSSLYKVLFANEGISKYKIISDIDKLKKEIASSQIDLLVIDVDKNWRDSLDVINRVRFGLLGGNPYVVIMASMAVPDEKIISPVVNSGIDDLVIKGELIKNFSAKVNNIKSNRNKFVVSRNYVGPIRLGVTHTIEVEKEEQDVLEVPNVFAMKLSGKELDMEKLAEEINKLSKRASKALLKSNADYLSNLVVCLQELYSTFMELGKYKFNLERLVGVIKISKRRIGNAGYLQVKDLYDTMEELAAKQLEDISKASKKHLRIMSEMIIAIKKAYEDKQEDVEAAKEISGVVRGFASGGVDEGLASKEVEESNEDKEGYDPFSNLRGSSNRKKRVRDKASLIEN